MSTLTSWAFPLLAATIKVGVVLLVAAALTASLRRASAASRHVVWVGALCSALALPGASRVLPALAVRVLPPPAAILATPSMNAPVTAIAGSDEFASVSRIVVANHPSTPQWDSSVAAGRVRARSTGGTLVLIWFGGIAVMALRAINAAVAIRRVRRRSLRLTDTRVADQARYVANWLGLRRPASIRIAHGDQMPVTWGIVVPRVLLPAHAGTWTDNRLTAVLVHELGHVARLDALWQGIGRVAVAVFWFHPLVWMAAWRSALERTGAGLRRPGPEIRDASV